MGGIFVIYKLYNWTAQNYFTTVGSCLKTHLFPAFFSLASAGGMKLSQHVIILALNGSGEWKNPSNYHTHMLGIISISVNINWLSYIAYRSLQFISTLSYTHSEE